ncbi:MAG TPA: hypothetical protein VFL67_06620, partial [Mycobacterium sp.]|nr:hypothetical protein [Mycobacterium sp.]
MSTDDVSPRVPSPRDPGGIGERLRAEVQELETQVVPGWLRPGLAENRIPLIAAILAAVALQLAIPARYGLHPRWLLPSLELVLLAALTAINPVRLTRSTRAGRYASLALVAAITVDNAFSAG